MPEFEVQTARGLAVRVDAEEEGEAVAIAGDELEDGDEGAVYAAEGVPVGMAGGDPEDDE